MNVNELYDAIHPDGLGKLDDVMIRTEGHMWVRLSCPIASGTTEALHSLSHDLVGLVFSEATNNDVCEVITLEKADLGDGFLYVTSIVIDWIT